MRQEGLEVAYREVLAEVCRDLRKHCKIRKDLSPEVGFGVGRAAHKIRKDLSPEVESGEGALEWGRDVTAHVHRRLRRGRGMQ